MFSRIKIIVFIICSLFVAGVTGYNDYRDFNQLYFVVDMETSASGAVQVFYDAGSSYNEQDSHSIPIQRGKLQKCIFPLSGKAIKSIRFDPINVSAVVRIKEARIINKQGYIIKKFPLQDFKSFQQIDKIDTIENTLVIHTVNNADDPIIVIENSSIDNHFSWNDYAVKRGWIILGYGLLSFLFLIGVSYFIIVFRRNKYIIGRYIVSKVDGLKKIFNNCWMPFLAFSTFAVMLFGIKLWVIDTYGNATPYWDQWDAEAANLYKPFIEGTLGWTDLFTPHNEHRIFTTRLLALALLTINGIWNPLLQMVINAAIHIVALVVSITMLTSVVGRKHLPALLGFSLVLFGVPYAWANTLAGFQSQFYFVILFSIASLWLTVTQPPLSARWWVGVVCAMFAFLSLASGIFALAAAAFIGLVFYAMGLRKTNKQFLAVGILAGLFTLGAVLTPSLAYHASLKSASVPQFFNALISALGWPLSSNLFSALVFNLPAFVFVGVMFWKRPPANDRKWFLLALVAWMLGQTLSIAYGRAVYNLSSRYLDLYAIGILVNFTCLISLAQNHTGNRHGWTIMGVSVWTITVLISLALYAGEHLPADLATKRDTGLVQEINIRNYLVTRDFTHLKDKPHLHVPYPDSKGLASILASPDIRAILPTNIRVPLEPVLIESQPADTFVYNGYYHSTPERTGTTSGSYSKQGNAATGRVTIHFAANSQSSLVAIPVAGYPLCSGIELEVENNNGQRVPIIMTSNPKESWKMAYINVGNGAFSIHLTDSSTTAWLAVGAPSVAGRLDALIHGLLKNYFVFIMLGLALGILSVLVSGLTSRVTKSTEER